MGLEMIHTGHTKINKCSFNAEGRYIMHTGTTSSGTAVDYVEHLTNFFGTPIDRQFVALLEHHLLANKVNGNIVDALVEILLERC